MFGMRTDSTTLGRAESGVTCASLDGIIDGRNPQQA
jgi:hypothetical protein